MQVLQTSKFQQWFHEQKIKKQCQQVQEFWNLIIIIKQGMSAVSAVYKNKPSDKHSEILQSCTVHQKMVKKQKSQNLHQIDFPDFITDFQSEEGQSEECFEPMIVKNDKDQLRRTQECQCSCHCNELDNFWLKQQNEYALVQLKMLGQMIGELNETKKQIQTEIQIQLENQQQMLKAYSNKITSFLKENISKISAKDQSRYISMLDETEKSNKSLKTKLRLLEQELTICRGELFQLKYKQNAPNIGHNFQRHSRKRQYDSWREDDCVYSIHDPRSRSSRNSSNIKQSREMGSLQATLEDIKSQIEDYYTHRK